MKLYLCEGSGEMRLFLDYRNGSNTGEVSVLLTLFVLDNCHHPGPSLYTLFACSNANVVAAAAEAPLSVAPQSDRHMSLFRMHSCVGLG